MIKVFSYLNLCLYLTKAIEYPEMYPDYYSDMYPEPSETYISEVSRRTHFTPAGVGTCLVCFILQNICTHEQAKAGSIFIKGRTMHFRRKRKCCT